MSDRVTIEITGLEEIRRNFQALAAMSPEDMGIVKAMNDEAETMMGISKREYCPVVSGTLKSSGQVDPPVVSEIFASVTLGYGGAAKTYAWSVHENPRTGKTGGFLPVTTFHVHAPAKTTYRKYKKWSQVGQWKFLETPVVQRRQNYFDAIAEAARDALNKRWGTNG